MPLTRPLSRPLTRSIARGLTEAGGGGGFDFSAFVAAGTSAAYYDLDPAVGYVFQDHFGRAPVTAASDPVGLVVPVNVETIGDDLYVGATPSIGGGWAWNSGARTGTATATSGTLRLPHANEAGTRRYVLDITVTVTGGTLTVYIGAAGVSFRSDITTSGTYKVHLLAGGAADVGTYLLGTAFTGTVLLNSVKAEHPLTRQQMTAASRGTYQVDANGKHYIDLTGGKSLSNASNAYASFAFPAFFGQVVGRASAAAAAIISNAGGTANFAFTNATSANSIIVGTSKAGTFHNVPTRSGAVPLNLPVPADLYVTVGQTSSYVAGGKRNIPDDAGLAAGELRTVSNNFVGTETSSAVNIIIENGQWYGGIIRMGAEATEADRQGIAAWLKGLAGYDVLDGQAYDIFCIAGQSNAMGVGTAATASSVPLGDGAEYIDSGYVKPFREPMQHSMPGQTSLTGSAWGAFCNQWFAATGRRALIAGAAWSGEGLINGSIVDGTWLNGELLTDNLALKLSTAIADTGGTFRGVLYMGGENDASVGFTQAQYEGYLGDFLAKLRTKTGFPSMPLLICSLDDTTGSPAAWATMRAAMVDAAANVPGIALVVPFQNYVIGQGLSSDGIHLNQTALNDMGTRAANGAKTALGL